MYSNPFSRSTRMLVPSLLAAAFSLPVQAHPDLVLRCDREVVAPGEMVIIKAYEKGPHHHDRYFWSAGKPPKIVKEEGGELFEGTSFVFEAPAEGGGTVTIFAAFPDDLDNPSDLDIKVDSKSRIPPFVGEFKKPADSDAGAPQE